MFAVQSELHLGGCIDRQAPTGDDAIGGSLIDKDVRVSTVSPLLQTSTVQPCDTPARPARGISRLQVARGCLEYIQLQADSFSDTG